MIHTIYFVRKQETGYSSIMIHTLYFVRKQDYSSIMFPVSGHGKGAVDGIGGGAKAQVRAEVTKRDTSKKKAAIVCNAKEFLVASSKILPNVRQFFVTVKEIKDLIESDNPWEGTMDAKGISKIHIVHAEKGYVEMWANDLDREAQSLH